MSWYIDESPIKDEEHSVALIQWKGTDACLDFMCGKCGYGGHFDGDFAYVFECFRCGTLWEAPAYIGYRVSQRPAEYGCVQRFDDWEAEE